ncbi:hypothetical protein E8F11_11070 [Pseudomonas sp. BN417]|uniref:hypothetical protein n=1 Tax=Pseudomonas sp. BN417 TaxID=2567890 RepID=UPI0024589D9F|nr:hypothetical protein [Pseudomonas sp. BN417]MDH4555709.1 hypothetical protein [Pseudomonas sp. BN417]
MAEVFQFFTYISIASLILYCFAWLVTPTASYLPSDETKNTLSFLWGALFAYLFYAYLFIGWYRYGFKRTFWILIGCLASVVLIPSLLVEDSDDLTMYSILMAVSVRAIAGAWVARNDCQWRHMTAESRRQARLDKKALKTLNPNVPQDQTNKVSEPT